MRAAVSGPDVVSHLNATIAWYQRINSVDQSTAVPQTVLLEDSVRQSAKQVVQTAFAFARAEAAYLASQKPKDSSPNASPAQSGSIEQAAAGANQRVTNLQDQIDQLNQAIDKSRSKARVLLVSQRDTLVSDLGLAKEAQSALKNMISFASSSDPSGGLLGQINYLQNSDSMPTIFNSSAQQPAPATHATQPPAFHPEATGLLGLIGEVITLARARSQVGSLMSDTDSLRAKVNKLEAPVRAEVKGLISEGDALAKAAANGTTDLTQLEAARKEIVGLTAQFKLLSGPIVPLGEQTLALNSAFGGLGQWRSALTAQLNSTLGYLAVRLGTLAAVIVAVLIASEISRRETFRYVRDARRRRQFVLIRRIVVGGVITLIAVLTFFSGFGSFATIAGFVTAGLAVALQNVILSVVAYFFLIGRYGLRAGDRVTVTGVTGEVIEVGLVRLYLLEFAGSGVDMHSTGRVAVFSNSVIFQPSPLLKQAPGTEYAWHTITTVLATGTDPDSARKRLEGAVETVFNTYRKVVEEQQKLAERTANIQLSTPVPVSRARYIESGTEVIVRYPVELADMATVDEEMVNSVVQEAAREPKLDIASGGFPKVTAT